MPPHPALACSWLPTFYHEVFAVDITGSSTALILPFLATAAATNASGWIADGLVNNKVGMGAGAAGGGGCWGWGLLVNNEVGVAGGGSCGRVGSGVVWAGQGLGWAAWAARLPG